MSTRSLLRHNAFSRTSAEGGGGSGGTVTAGDNPPANPQPTTATNATNDPPKNAVDEAGNDLGFPEKTSVDAMTDAQKAAYWRNESKKQQARVPKNLDQLLRDSQELATLREKQMTPDEQAVQAARTEGLTQGRREAAEDSVMVALRTSFQMRGKTEAEVSDLLDVVSPSKFLTDDGKVDASKVTGYVNRLAPAAGSPGGSPGQGRREQAPDDKKAAGKAESDRRFGNLKNDAQRGTFGGLRRG